LSYSIYIIIAEVAYRKAVNDMQHFVKQAGIPFTGG